LLCSVGGSCYALAARLRIDKIETPLCRIYVTYWETRTAAGRQFGWGGTLLKRYQQGPKVNSRGLEILWGVQEQKLA